MVESHSPRLIISASSRRSGSTWVQRIVHAATNIFVWGESFPLVELLASLYANFKIDAPVRFQETKSFLAGDQNPTAWVANINPPFSNLKNAVGFLFSQYYDASEHPLYGWKEVHYGRREIEFLRELFPELRIVLLVRNPVDVVQSLISWNGIGRWEDTVSIPMVCEYWSARTNDYLQLKDVPNILFLRYEDVHSRLQDLLDFVSGSINEKVDKAVNTKVGGVEKYPVLSTKDMRIIFDVCGREMETLGYLKGNLENWGLHRQAISKHKIVLPSPRIEDGAQPGEKLAWRRELLMLNSQMIEKEQVINVLSSQVVDQEDAIQKLAKEKAEGEQAIVTLGEHLSKGEQNIAALETKFAEQENIAQGLSKQVVEKEQVVQTLTLQAEKKERAVQELTTQMVEKEQAVKGLNAQLVEKENSLLTLSMQVTNNQETIRNLREIEANNEQQIQIVNLQLQKEEHRLRVLTQQLSDKDELLSTLSVQMDENEHRLRGFVTQLNDIYISTGWKLLQMLWGIRLRLAPRFSPQERLGRLSMKVLYLWNDLGIIGIIRMVAEKISVWAKELLEPPSIFADVYPVVDNTIVTLYTEDKSLLPNYVPRNDLRNQATSYRRKVSLITTIKNEVDNVDMWAQAIFNQTRLPDEIVVVDTGSSDGTQNFLNRIASQSPIPIKIISEKGANIAKGRNLAISNTRYEIIAVTDLGCIPLNNWLEKIIMPFEMDTETQVVAGRYEVVNQKGNPLYSSELFMWSHPENIFPGSYLPPGGSAAFLKSAWDSVFGYPEWLSLTGEDTFFDFELKRLGGKWAFVPNAIVKWHGPENMVAYLRKMYRWSIGDGESGIRGRYYWQYTLGLCILTAGLSLSLLFALIAFLSYTSYFVLCVGILALTWFTSIFVVSRKSKMSTLLFQDTMGKIAKALGFLKGVRGRRDAYCRRFVKTKGIFYIFSGVPIDDTGGGARGTQIALELLRRDFVVVYINKYPKQESRELNLNISHPNLFRFPIEKFLSRRSSFDHLSVFKEKSSVSIIEFPMSEFQSAISILSKLGCIIAYDLIDDWETSLGRGWYSKSDEMKIINSSQLLIASAPLLVSRMEKMAHKSVALLQNGVNHRIFDPDRTYLRPSDMPVAERTATYVGALWGDWFDWDLLCDAAQRLTNISFVVIGDYRGQCKCRQSNLHFLGLKAQTELPAYLAFSDVTIIPWKVNAITQATSPLKIYEYLAMHCPVVVPNLLPLSKMPGVFFAKNAGDFVKLVDQVGRSSVNAKELSAYIMQHSWRARVDQLLDLVRNV